MPAACVPAMNEHSSCSVPLSMRTVISPFHFNYAGGYVVVSRLGFLMGTGGECWQGEQSEQEFRGGETQAILGQLTWGEMSLWMRNATGHFIRSQSGRDHECSPPGVFEAMLEARG